MEDESIEAVYCAVPHHLHEELYTAALRAGKHLLGEKPFGIDLPANEAINREIAARPDLLVRCSSELPFYPGGQEVVRFVRERRFGRVIEVRSLFLHSSDLDPEKPINWKRRAALNGAYGCLGDLGMHALHLPLRAGWAPKERAGDPDGRGARAPGRSRRHGALRHVGQRGPPLRGGGRRACRSRSGSRPSGSRLARRTRGRSRSTAPKPRSRTRPSSRRRSGHWCSSGACRRPGGRSDLGSVSAYPTITGAIFEFGFSDAILQMWAAFLDELAHGRERMRQPFYCATPEEAAADAPPVHGSARVTARRGGRGRLASEGGGRGLRALRRPSQAPGRAAGRASSPSRRAPRSIRPGAPASSRRLSSSPTRT